MAEDPTLPAFWDERYAAHRTPWDQGGVPAATTRFLAAHPGAGARVLIPGCGSGHELEAFARAGYAVTAIDLSAAAVEQTRRRLGPRLASTVIQGDFFTHDFKDAPFDLVYERTFLCALPPELWPKIATRTAALLKPGGMLAGIYYFGDKDDGPPFGLEAPEPAALFDRDFALVTDEPVPPSESLPLFAGRERWQERRKRDARKAGGPADPGRSLRSAQIRTH